MKHQKHQQKNREEKQVKAILDGDKQALRKLYLQFKPKLTAYLKVKVSVKADQDELFQDIFISFIDALPLYSYRSSLWTFFMGIARHEVADYYRKKYAKKVIQTLPLLQTIYDRKLYSSTETQTHLIKMVEAVYQHVSADYEKILRLKYEDDLSIKEIAGKLNLSAKATESRLYRARMAFQKSYRNLYGEPEFAVIKSVE